MQALWMVLASFWFALMAVGIKFASHSFGTFELVFYRGIVSIIFMGIVVRARGATLRTPVPMMHLWRSFIGVASLSSWFYAIAHLPLATAMTLNYMSGVWVAAFVVGGALLYGKNQPQGALLGTVFMGFAGVVMTLRPTIDQNQLFGGVVGLLSGLGSALAYMQVTALGKVGEPEERTVFYFSVGSAVVGGVGTLFTHITPWSEVAWQDAAWVIPIGILASLGQWCMTRAYRKGATLVVASMQYSGIVFAVVFSLVLFGDHIAPMGWAGIAVIVTSGVLATILRSRALPDTPAEEH
ncbi:DMT family transporter [Rhodoferax saidenbachensis]|uniref:S-adenosylmethionine uptake transporter n=1 Tax=Rhodoferax saidenbachensis TaxID=1484693 RepID=A0ABU1ZPR2_9BURK|nr:DMT family transporter [Rhodoferax saidenbachensis]MDR7306511.1 S-adenosylmethionine uptake transporter [Rhodoferax saidenbachensis]